MEKRTTCRLFVLLFAGMLFLAATPAEGQRLTAKVIDSLSHQPVEGANIVLLPAGATEVTDGNGTFLVTGSSITDVRVSAAGYETRTVPIADLTNGKNSIFLASRNVELATVTVSAHAGDQYRPISKMDIAMRGVTNSQEVLRIVPGLFIGQHQGGGKAEQIFLRGFDCDHGTDISLHVDGLPINMVSHAHGQGFADSHFIIPETIEDVNFKKGPYYAEKGDFCTTGYVDFHTKDYLGRDELKLEAGMFNSYRLMAMVNLLRQKNTAQRSSWYAATEYRYSDSYFDNPQHFQRFNFFTKYNTQLSTRTSADISASVLYSKWRASGQIPDRVVEEGLIGFFGALDPNEGGITSRTNVNARFTTSFRNGDVLKNQLYYSYYTFDLHTNFTFFLVDSVNGDEIRQRESRNLFGYNSSYTHAGYWGRTKLTTEGGLTLRADATANTELSHTRDRYVLLDRIKLGNITEIAAGAYLSETLRFSERFSINTGLRFDQFFNRYNNKLASDSTLSGAGIYTANDNIVSPKLSLYYHASKNTEFYLSAGKGFHSNDVRAAVAENGTRVLPAAYGADLGTSFKPTPKLFINAALWYIFLDQEFVYGGDGGSVEFSGKTKRMGFDFTGRYQPLSSLYVDVDVNYAHGRAVDEAKGQDYIPLAPIWSSTGGLTYIRKRGINGSIRYRYLADRPANEDYSLTAKGYFVNDLVLNYTQPKYEIGLTVNNVFDVRWKETQFATETRLRGEPSSVEEICFTPGTPFAAKLSFTLFFK